jgi:hypothetical protein
MPATYPRPWRWLMVDVVLLAITVGFFALAFAFAAGMDRI